MLNISTTKANQFRPWCIAVVLLGTISLTACLETILQSRRIAGAFMSGSAWESLVVALGGQTRTVTNSERTAEIDFLVLLALSVSFAIVTWIAGSSWVRMRRGGGWKSAMSDWGRIGWLWWLIPGCWELFLLLSAIAELTWLQSLLTATISLCLSMMFGGWLATLMSLAAPPNSIPLDARLGADSPSEPPTKGLSEALLGGKNDATESRTTVLQRARKLAQNIPIAVWLLMAIYVVVFTAMNWQLYRGLLIPHGDSAMYEEHLWNVMHGKGFRSYLDQGLFLGEHVQVIHLLLLPLHWLWGSHLLLELCETLALAAGAIPLFCIAWRHTGSRKAAVMLVAAYLAYFPLQFLDIAIDLKTFRPISFGVPLLLLVLDLFERRRLAAMSVTLLLTLACKEDFALIIGPLGVWIAVSHSTWISRIVRRFRRRDRTNQQPDLQSPDHDSAHPSDSIELEDATSQNSLSPLRRVGLGWGISIFAVLYLLAVLKIVIPWFRDGDDPHYAAYFKKFGESISEIGLNMLTNPGLLFSELLTVNSAVYFLAFLLPLGFIPLLSPGRLLVALPLFTILCLNEIAQDPRHHFHAPLLPIVFWAAAAGLGNAKAIWQRSFSRGAATATKLANNSAKFRQFCGHLAWTSAVISGLFFSLSPLGLRFWDEGSNFHWRKLFVVGPRAEHFEKVFELIPQGARVASTDFVHTRFTHHERSYDYSEYLRKASGYKQRVPEDTDYIVIDTRHRYSKIKVPNDIPEYRNDPSSWELLPDNTDGYFIVLKRIWSPAKTE